MHYDIKMVSVLQETCNVIIHAKSHPETAIPSSSDIRWKGLITQLRMESLLIVKPSSHWLSSCGLSKAAEGSAPKPQSSDVQTSHQGRNPGCFQPIIIMLSTKQQGEQLGFRQNNQRN